jgi:nucleoside-diphosphate-sugar epimerase
MERSDIEFIHCLDKAEDSSQDLLSITRWPQDIDTVIHLAGRSGVRESMQDPASYWLNNVEAGKRLFAAYPNARIIYASSSSAYEPDLNPYAASKFILEETAVRHENNIGLRFHTVYSESPRAGMFLDRLLNKTLEYVTTHYRDFIHLEDVLDAIEAILDSNYRGDVIDVGSGNPIKISSLVTGIPIRLHATHERHFTCADITSLLDLGWSPQYDFLTFLDKITFAK